MIARTVWSQAICHELCYHSPTLLPPAENLPCFSTNPWYPQPRNPPWPNRVGKEPTSPRVAACNRRITKVEENDKCSEKTWERIVIRCKPAIYRAYLMGKGTSCWKVTWNGDMLVCKRVNLVQPAWVRISKLVVLLVIRLPGLQFIQLKFQERWNYSILILPETNMAPARRPSQKETHLPTPVIHVLC